VSRVLLVDDRAENLVALQAILEPLGHELVLAGSGEEALRELLRADVSVILLDVRMPGLDGFETAELIKGRKRTRDIPIVFLTAISKDAGQVFRGYEKGAVDYIFKPFEPEILRSKVAALIELHEKAEALRRQEEALREREVAELRRAGEFRYRNLADAMPQIVWTANAEGRADYVNRRWFEYTGLSVEETRADDVLRHVVHPDDLPALIERWREAVAAGAPFELQYRMRRAEDESYRWHLVRALPTTDADGRATGWVGTSTDIDDQKRSEEMRQFLLEAGALLAGSLDYASTLATVARLAVPRIADWCAIDVIDGTELRPLAVRHVDPAQAALAEELRRRYPPPADADRGPHGVVRTGEPELLSEIPSELLEQTAVDELHLDLMRQLGPRSSMCVPLVSRGRTLGTITFVSDQSGRRFDEADLGFAQELARQAAAAVDNARLYMEAENRAQAARALASVADGVFLVDGAGVIRLWNAAAEAITGLRADELLGRRAEEALPGWAEIEGRVALAGAPGPTGSRAESVPIEVDGRELWLSLTGVEVEDGAVYAFRDLTEERAVEKMKSDFVATVSHELRTPLAAIYGSALTMRRPDLTLADDVRERLLAVVAEESTRLAEIIDDILLASHLDSGRLSARVESCDARTLTEGVLEAAGTHLPESVSLVLDAPKRLPRVAADPGQLRQVLANVVDNAVKYSPEGGEVRVALEQRDRRMRIAVRDSGLGIPAKEQARIFEKFYRLDPDMTRGIGGTGLGLYICRELVRRVGGRIWVESRVGEGSTFFVEVPLADGARAQRKRPARTAQAATRPARQRRS
jgi:PAS domain S-box-containing protein